MLLVKFITFWYNIKYKERVLNKLWSFCLNLDNNFYFFVIIEFSIKTSRDPNSHTPHPRDPDLGLDLSLLTTAVKGEYDPEMNESSQT